MLLKQYLFIVFIIIYLIYALTFRFVSILFLKHTYQKRLSVLALLNDLTFIKSKTS
jgi:hypothetical protein